MLRRFCLYGFLKNQRYFEPFLVLAFLEKGLSFFAIGTLIAFREIAVNALEIPSGAIADVCGRRGAMVVSLVAYVVSFVVFALAPDAAWLFAAMLLFAVGEAFRSGTHKAMIFTWLALQDRRDERTRIYGYTRSWSKYGSAVSVVIATALVFATESYALAFACASVPYLLNIANLLGYPRELEGEPSSDRSGKTVAAVVSHMRSSLRATVRRAPLRRLVLESMGFEGVFHATKDYLQPLLLGAAAAGTWAAGELSDVRRSALLIGPVYLVLFALSGVASRCAHRVVAAVGGGDEDRTAHRLWAAVLVVYVSIGWAAYFELYAVVAAAFIALHVVQNVWRPVLISRFDIRSHAAAGATMLSIESQARRLATFAIAPALGLAVDLVAEHGRGGAFWPVGVAGALAAAVFALAGVARRG